jgi:uncharacterized delta-60 repeat protein
MDLVRSVDMSFGVAAMISSKRRRINRFICEALEGRTLLSYGLDKYFGNSGTATVTFGLTSSSGPNSVATLPDGSFYTSCIVKGQFALAKFDFNGQLDPTFGTAGATLVPKLTPYGLDNGYLAVQPDGKLILAADSVYQMMVLRYNPDGTLDTTFGSGNGYSINQFSYGDFVSGVTICPDSKILIFGFSNNGNHYRAEMTRYSADGTLDTSFGSGGNVISDLGPFIGGPAAASSEFNGVVFLDNGDMVLSGYAASQPMIARYLPGGTLDPTFADQGVAHQQTINGMSFNGAGTLSEAPDGGFYTPVISWAGNRPMGLTKWTTAGAIDTSWGTAGLIDSGFAMNAVSGKSLIQPDGTVLVFVAHTNNTVELTTVAADGSSILDDVTWYGSGSSNALALQPDGLALVGFPYSGYDTEIFRYRTMPDSTEGVRLEGSILTVLGEHPSNSVDLATDGSNLAITLNGSTVYYPASSVSRVNVRLNGSGNTVTSGSAFPLNVLDMGIGTNNTAIVTGGTLYTVGAGSGGDIVNLPAPTDGGNGKSSAWAAATDVLNIGGTAAAEHFNLSATSVTTPGRQITLVTPTGVQLTTGDGDDTVDINVPNGPPITVRGGAGHDTFTISNGGGNAATPVTIYGGSGTNTLAVTAAANKSLNYIPAPASLGNDVTVNLTGSATTQKVILNVNGLTTTDGFALNTGAVLALSSLELDDTTQHVVYFDYTGGVNPLPALLRLKGNFLFEQLLGVDPFKGRELDIGASTLFIDGYPTATLNRYLHNGYNGGTWDGKPTATTGVITSSVAASAQPNTISVAMVDPADGVVSGLNFLELRVAATGDANLDGKVDATDAILLARHYVTAGPLNWDFGNFNYDLAIDIQDATLLQNNFDASFSPTLTAAAVNAGAAAPVTPQSTALLTSSPQASVGNWKDQGMANADDDPHRRAKVHDPGRSLGRRH